MSEEPPPLCDDIVVEPDDATGTYTAHCPSKPGCVGIGATEEIAVENLRRAISRNHP
jgi:predicted RNase H-like HicB family nuclease